jgi:hypothetical protein
LLLALAWLPLSGGCAQSGAFPAAPPPPSAFAPSSAGRVIWSSDPAFSATPRSAPVPTRTRVEPAVRAEPVRPPMTAYADGRPEIVTAGLGLPRPTQWGYIDGRRASQEELAEYLPRLRRELALYPPEMFRRAGLRRVVVASGLTFNRRPWAGVPVFDSGDLILDASAGRDFPEYQARVIHHEFFHMIDYAERGTLRGDGEWEGLNPWLFRYGGGGERCRSSGRDVSDVRKRTNGFITGYAESAPEEDKAELFGCLMVRPSETARVAASDPVLAAKIALLRRRLDAFTPGGSSVIPSAPAVR